MNEVNRGMSTYLLLKFSIFLSKFVNLLLHLFEFLLLLKSALKRTFSVLKQPPFTLGKVRLLDLLLDFKQLVVG